MSDIKVNFTDEEATSEARSYEPLPTGDYPVHITKVETKFVKKEGKNKDKPFWNMELTVKEEHKNAGAKLFATCMLFDGALYTLAQIMRAMGLRPGTDEVPSPDEVQGTELVAAVLMVKDDYKMKKAAPGSAIIFKSEVKGFKPINGVTNQTSAGKSTAGPASMLP